MSRDIPFFEMFAELQASPELRLKLAGAAVLAARGCLRAGVGKLTVTSPKCGYQILQTAVPEALYRHNRGELNIVEIHPDRDFSAFAAGPGMGTNPIQMMQALSAQVIRHKRIMSDRCVFVVSSICDAWFHEERWPYLRELYEMFQHDSMNILPDMNRYGEYFATKEEYIRKYRFANAFHPFHGFSMMSCGHLAEEHTSAIYIAGAREPGIARGMGLKTRATVEEALADAMKKYVGPNPNILALPKTFTTAAVHLCMKDPAENSHTRDGHGHPCCG